MLRQDRVPRASAPGPRSDACVTVVLSVRRRLMGSRCAHYARVGSPGQGIGASSSTSMSSPTLTTMSYVATGSVRTSTRYGPGLQRDRLATDRAAADDGAARVVDPEGCREGLRDGRTELLRVVGLEGRAMSQLRPAGDIRLEPGVIDGEADDVHLDIEPCREQRLYLGAGVPLARLLAVGHEDHHRRALDARKVAAHGLERRTQGGLGAACRS